MPGVIRNRCPFVEAISRDVFHISPTLIAIATETEQTAEKLGRDKFILTTLGGATVST